jgi:RNA polymerase sigma-70 factor, ECF subfamily
VTPPSRGKRPPEPAVTDSPAADPAPTDRAPTDRPAVHAAPTDPPAANVPASNLPATDPPATDPPATEASLIARAQAGDVGAFEQLSGAYADRLYMLLLRLLGDRDEAGDVAQEVMLRAWQGIGGFQGRSSFFTWLYRIAVNEANRALERRARRPASVSLGPQELQLPASPADDPSRQAEVSELRLALGQALAELPPALRTAIVLRDVEGLSTQEAAEIAGVSQAAFKSRLHQARLRVRAAIGDQALVTAGG